MSRRSRVVVDGGEWQNHAGASLKALGFGTRLANRCRARFSGPYTPERVNRRRHSQSQSPPDQAPRLSSVAMITAADIDPTAMNSPKFRLIAVQCVRPRPEPPGDRARTACWERAPIETRGAGVTRVLRAAKSRPRPGTPHRACSTPHASFRPSSCGASPRERDAPACPIPTTRHRSSFLRARASSVRPLPLLRPSFRGHDVWRDGVAEPGWPVPTR